MAEESTENTAASSAPVGLGGGKKKVEKRAWTLARCLKFARRFSSEQEWQVGAPSSWKAATAHGWMNECRDAFQASGSVVPMKKKKAPKATLKASA